MKILYVITGLSQGGAERVVCDLADKMFERGHEVKIVYLTGKIYTRPSNPEINIIKVNLNHYYSLPKAYLSLSFVIKHYQPDIIHSHMVHANILTRLVRLITPMKKLISTAHNSNEGGWQRMWVYRLTHNLANITTNVSKEASLSFEEKMAVPKGGMLTLYNGIDLNKYYWRKDARASLLKEFKISLEDNIILSVGRLTEQKDFPNLLHAIYELKNSSEIKFKLLIAGDGEEKNNIMNLIQKLSLSDDVLLLGRRDDIPNLMSAADLFVLPSKYEGFGLVVAEAMACRCLVVATDSGGVSEVLNNNNFLSLSSDSHDLCNKIQYALTLDKDTRKNVIIKNLKHVEENFSLDSIIDKWIDIYNA